MSKYNLKYDVNLYTDSGFFDGDMDDSYMIVKEKVVRCRTDHECCGQGKHCKHILKKDDCAVCVITLFREEGFKTSYVCTNCMEDWLEESHQVEIK